ncbi:hypothetical protein MK489_21360 [Myxococcota bacterium]|nr:hypothetical protein [Myxococcota bacterium]
MLLASPRVPGPGRREGRVALLLALLAAARVGVFSAAFPFFTNIDEHRHVDVVLKYARGYLPAPGDDAYEANLPLLLGLYGSPEYHFDRARPLNELPQPAWLGSRSDQTRRVEAQRRYLASRRSLEANEAPVYYATAGAWWWLGRELGLQGAWGLYWVRALNALAAFVMVLGSYFLMRGLPGLDSFRRLGVPALLAVFPQDSQYFITRDAFSPLVSGIAFLWVVGLAIRSRSGGLAYVGVGALLAAAVLVKYTNLAVGVVAAACFVFAATQRPDARRLKGEGGRWLLLFGVALTPVVWWWVRNQLLFGDFTGSNLKVERMGWGTRALGDIVGHPLLTLSGVTNFVLDLIPSFWRGQLAWFREDLAWGPADGFYTVTSLVFVLLVAGTTWRKSAQHEAASGALEGAILLERMALLAIVVSVVTLALLSLRFVFHEYSNPSAARPWFDQGRLIAGALVPFALLYVRGLQIAVSPLGATRANWAAWCGLALTCALVLGSEVALTLPVFSSPYNGFHLP